MSTNFLTQVFSGIAGGILILLYLAFIIFWMAVAWRFVSAHEKIADSTDEIRVAVRTWFKAKNKEQ